MRSLCFLLVLMCTAFLLPNIASAGPIEDAKAALALASISTSHIEVAGYEAYDEGPYAKAKAALACSCGCGCSNCSCASEKQSPAPATRRVVQCNGTSCRVVEVPITEVAYESTGQCTSGACQSCASASDSGGCSSGQCGASSGGKGGPVRRILGRIFHGRGGRRGGGGGCSSCGG